MLSNFKTKKGESVVFVWRFYGRFLSAKKSKAKPMIIATIIAAAAMPMYISVEGKGFAATGYGDVRYGEKKAAIAAAVFYITAVALTPVTWLLGLVSIWFVPFVLVTDCGLVVSSVLLLKDYSRDNSRRIKNMVLLWFIFGLLAYIFGTFK